MNERFYILKKYNFWGNNYIDLGYLRTSYIRDLDMASDTWLRTLSFWNFAGPDLKHTPEISGTKRLTL
jgi:hypothetical protein